MTKKPQPLTTEHHAAHARVASAIKHLEAARTQLDAACADISSIIGASADYNRIRKLSISLVETRRKLDDNYHESTQGASALIGRQWKLDHTPKTSEAAEHGCGLVEI